MWADMTKLRGAFRKTDIRSVCVCVCVCPSQITFNQNQMVIKFYKMQCDWKTSLYRSIYFTIINNTNMANLQILMRK